MLAAPSGASAPARGLVVVAAENMWGSIAAQIAGRRATVVSVIVNPDTDPHAYEPTAADARLLAVSNMAIVNGIGYDVWASELLAADPSGTRIVLDVGRVLGLSAGSNPHQWYAPASVLRVAAAITAGYDKLDPADASYFAERERRFERTSLARYDELRAEIRRRFVGVPVGYSESIFQPLGSSLGLHLLTPPAFAKAVAEGAEVSSADLQTVDRQTQQRMIKVWIFNSQNETPDVQQVNTIARARGIPIVMITETLSPARSNFEQWQVAQLGRLIAALHRATGR